MTGGVIIPRVISMCVALSADFDIRRLKYTIVPELVDGNISVHRRKEIMKNKGDLDNLIDNFDLHTFWNKREFLIKFGLYAAAQVVITGLFARSVMNMSESGAVPKGMTFGSDCPSIVR